MEVLELKPIKNKNITVYLIEKPKNSISSQNLRCLIDFLLTKEIKFISIDLEDKDLKNVKNASIVKLLEEIKVPYHFFDIPEYAQGYIYEEISQKEEQLNELLEEYLKMPNSESIKRQNLKSWLMMLEEEIREKKAVLKFKLKPMWIVKKILDVLRIIESKEIFFIHLSIGEIFLETARLFKELNINVIALQRTENYVAFSIIINEEEIEEWRY